MLLAGAITHASWPGRDYAGAPSITQTRAWHDAGEREAGSVVERAGFGLRPLAPAGVHQHVVHCERRNNVAKILTKIPLDLVRPRTYRGNESIST